MDNESNSGNRGSAKRMGALITHTIHREPAPIRLKLAIIMGAVSSHYGLPAKSSSGVLSPLGFCEAEVPGGTHICMFYENEGERHQVIVNFLHAGVENNEKCMYACGDHSIPEVKESLQDRGLDVNGAVDRGALNIFRGSDFYGNGDFDPDETIVKADSKTSEAMTEGYPTVRFSGEIHHARESDCNHQKVIEYEHKMNHQFFSNHPAVAICLYNIRYFSDNFLDQIIQTHPYFIYQGQFRRNPSFGLS